MSIIVLMEMTREQRQISSKQFNINSLSVQTISQDIKIIKRNQIQLSCPTKIISYMYKWLLKQQVIFQDDKILRKIKVQESNDSTFMSFPRNQFPLIQYQLYPQYYANYPQEQYQALQYQITNPILQSQDRFLGQPKQVQSSQHFRTSDFQFFGSHDDSESIEPNQAEKDSKDQKNSYFKLKSKIKKGKVNDTKNITKNFSKAIISYIIQNKDIGLKIMNCEQFEEFVSVLKDKKNQMTNIKQLRELWVDTNQEKSQQFNKAFRIFSEYFLKQQSVSYIYNSRIANTGWHLKYRYNLLRALKEPENFKYIKDI
ncbi:unnamed protein product (macronuclear) [Paramecium tetraurelia]|uniref:Uncharacterized protein n=1 Tax=Paramecium tetraurelia TaxID=5888 RepID=A0ED17_PARTE|nr:uncharacterized protein GSPATT00004053001 [Paramecium tetraurelia]CAK93184.1 unnamed protein product [Paramecium tetraurelia]|eukprot:XP_001460581.1 hypothetical protein (macronuclear) [Paramecium tetraurelia strain d4-2]